jgi:hypothetical protein
MKKSNIILIIVSMLIYLTGCPEPSPPPSSGDELIDDWPEESILERSEQTTHHIVTSLEVTNNNCFPTKIVVIFPLPR